MTISETFSSNSRIPARFDRGLHGAEWLDRSESGKTFDVSNPATGEVIAILPDMSRSEPHVRSMRPRGAKGMGGEDGQERPRCCATSTTS